MERKTVKLTEENIKRIIKEEVRNTLFSNDEDRIMEYMWLKPKITGLKVDIFVDDGGSYKRHGHPLILLARNGYDKSVSSFLVFLVGNNPLILNQEIDFGITYNDIFAIQDFIQANYAGLQELADGNLTQREFAGTIRIPSYIVTEAKKLLNEMATLRIKDSGLPMDVWLDEGATYVRHAPRLKFRASNDQRTTREFSSMLLTNPPTIENFPKNSPLKTEDLEKLSEFVVNNLELLLSLANGEIDYTSEFLPNMEI